MKKIVFLSMLIISLISCNNSNSKNEVKVEKSINAKEVDNTEKIEKIFKEFKTLYNELLEIKNKRDFKKYGFEQGGPYYEWLTKVENLKKNPDAKLLLQKNVIAGELEQLGLAYASSKGKETELTKSFNKIFSKAISSKPIEKVKTASGKSNYEKIKSEYKLFGKWKIINSIINISYPYEIYKKGNKYIGVTPENEFNTDIIVKKGNKYLVKGNEYGKYFKISSSKEMRLFDEEGPLDNVGYIAIKQ